MPFYNSVNMYNSRFEIVNLRLYLAKQTSEKLNGIEIELNQQFAAVRLLT